MTEECQKKNNYFLNTMLNELEKYDIVSFNIFDTLILRDVLFPQDILKLLAKEVEKEYGVKDFNYIRMNIEAEVRNRAVQQDNSKEDIPLDEVYAEIGARYPELPVHEIKNMECELEISHSKNVDNIPSSVPHTEQGVRVTAAIVQEIKDGQLVFEWDSTDYPELYALNSAADYYNKSEYWTDYIHLNSVAVDPADNNLVLSLSNADTIIKIDRTSGKILWKLGGLADEFGLSDEQKFSHQNDVRITSDGAITMFNNGVPKVTVDENGQTVFGQSTIIKLRINEASKTLVSFEEYACDGAYSPDMGSAQELSDGRYVVGWGERYTATPLFSEIDFKSGKTLFALVRPNYNGSNLYRVYKCQS